MDIRQDFVDAARRARDVGFEWLELHFAHGYLAQSFFAAASNQRDDIYSAASASVLPGYWLWNASVSAGPENANWRVGLWARNLFNTEYEETRNNFNGGARPTSSPNEGRTIGARLTMDF